MSGEFHVTVRFTKNGPAVTGTWTSETVALRKFRAFVGSHGSIEGARIVLQEETREGLQERRSWTGEDGEVIR